MLQLGFPFGGLRHEVVVLGLELLVVGPVGVADVVGAVQGAPCGLDQVRGYRWRPFGPGGGGVGL